jgi:hypothetical protein
MEIQYKRIEETHAVMMRLVVHRRADIQTELGKLSAAVPKEQAAGPPFCVFNFISSVVDGYDVTLGVPVVPEVESLVGSCQTVPAIDVLYVFHHGEPEKPGASISAVFAYADEHAIISDEFYREVYLGENDPGGPGVEIQFVIHDWNGRLAAGLERVLGAGPRETVMQGSETLAVESGVDERFQWVKGMLARLDGLASEHEKWDVISGCAHVFPQGQIDKLTGVFRQARAETDDPLQAVDAVIAFMEADAGWADGGTRAGYTVYSAKSPRDPEAYAKARNDLERRQAYCYCPLVRNRMDRGMPVDFCHCGSGWFRQQWEGATGKPVTIEIVKSVLRGDDHCEFAVHLSEEI